MGKNFKKWRVKYEANKSFINEFCMGIEFILSALFLLFYIQPFLTLAGDIGGLVPYIGSGLLIYLEKKYGLVPWDFFSRLEIHWHLTLISVLIGVNIIAHYTLKPFIIFLRKDVSAN